MDKLNYKKNLDNQTLSSSNGFTIVELLVVIVVIGVLAAITIVSYTGISQRAKIASLESDLSNASKQLKLFQITNPNNDYPTTINCGIADSDTNKCIKSSNGSTYSYTPSNSTNPKTFVLTNTNSTTVYKITENSSPTAVISLAVSDPVNWIQVGTQVWAKYNLNVGARVAGITTQTNNGGGNVVEKYCYGDSDANCTANNNGGLYQWDEAMKYVATPTPPAVVQGVCPDDSHIPSDAEFKTLEMFLGMTQVQADTTGWRGTDQGTKLKATGSSGLEVPLAGNRFTDKSFYFMSINAYLWSSSDSGVNAWARYFNSGAATVDRSIFDKTYGFSVRCLGN